MSLLMPPPRVDETGFIGTFPEKSRRGTIKSIVSINISAVTEDIRNVLAEWDEMDLDELLSTVPFARPTEYPADEVSAVEFVADRLRIPVERVLSAVGVKSRTYYGWKERARRPRTSSIGRLWAAVEPIFYLAQSRQNLVAWFAETPEAQALWDAGDFDGFVALELESRIRAFDVVGSQAPYTHLQDVAAGPSAGAGDRPRRTPLHPVPVGSTVLRKAQRRIDD